MTTRESGTINEPADEKAPEVGSAHIEYSAASDFSQNDAQLVRDFPAAQQKRVFRRINWLLMPMLMSLYLIANIYQCVRILPPDKCGLRLPFPVKPGKRKDQGPRKLA